MKATELRIGNYVNYECIALEIKELIYKIENGADIQVHQNHGFFKPITLTEQWLKDFGFKDNKGALGGWLSADINKPFVHRLIIRSDFTYFTDLSSFTFIEVKYVHQLQNLYFALTEKELNR